MGRLHLLFNIGLHRRVKMIKKVVFAREGESASFNYSFLKYKSLTALGSRNLD